MRRVDRSKVAAPPSLTTPSAAVAVERAAAATHYGDPPALAPGAPPPRVRPHYNGFTQYKNYDVGLALTLLFNGKCAYCESEVGAPNDEEIEHYRPKGGVTEDEDHNGYWWLASDWENLLLSCTGCNQGRKHHLITPDMDEQQYLALIAAPPTRVVGKLNQFPVGGTRARHPADDLTIENPYLIDPTRRDPTPSLVWCSPKNLSIVLPAPTEGGEDPHGAATIAVCALNRWKLVKARTELLQELRLQRTALFEELQADDSPDGIARGERTVERMRRLAAPGKPYSAMVKAFVDDLADEFREWVLKKRGKADG